MKKIIENCRRMRILAPEHRANVKCDDCRGRAVCPTSDYVGRDGEHEETVADVLNEMRGTLNRIEETHKREVAELRKCLNDAIELFCATCSDKDEDTDKCKDKDGVCPPVSLWRKALEGSAR